MNIEKCFVPVNLRRIPRGSRWNDDFARDSEASLILLQIELLRK